ncbi:type IX secretion system protein PorQ [Flavitalea flava]
MRLFSVVVLLAIFNRSPAQTLGGNTVFNFLNLANTPQLAALGGINVSAISEDVGLSFTNPALLRSSMHMQLDASFNSFYAGIRNYSVWMAAASQHLQTTFAAGVNYFDYGNISQTDAAGNILGAFHPADYVAQVAASRRYEKKWFYGVTLKFIHSGYGLYGSSGAAMDIGINYYDSARLLQIGLTARNMGVQFKSYQGTKPGDLPFDLELGITKRLAKAPLQFSFTAFQLQRFDTRYNDTSFNNFNGFDQQNKNASSIADKIFRHFILAAQVYPGDKVEISLAYNYIRRKELNIGSEGNGFTGFSMGLGILLKKWQLRYARGYYQNNTGYNQLGLNLTLSD